MFILSNMFLKVFFLNVIWVNVFGLLCYFFVVKLMFYGVYFNNFELVLVLFFILIFWGVWIVMFLIVLIGFYWMYYDWYGNSSCNVLIGVFWFLMGIFGFIWFGIVNMGMVFIFILFVVMLWVVVE